MNFCDILKDLRQEKGVTQKEVAINSDLTPTCICQLENGTRNPTGSTVKALALYFNCTADYLLGLEDDFGIKKSDGAVAPPAFGIKNEQEQELIDCYRKLSPYLQGLALETVRGWSGEGKDSKKADILSKNKRA